MNRVKKMPAIVAVLFGFALVRGADAKEAEEWINPFIGAVTYPEEGCGDVHGFGKCFPGAATPFGLVQLSPDTVTGGDHGCGYSWSHKTIEGFSFTHLSGVGAYGDLGNIEVQPTTGPLVPDRDGAKSAYSHAREMASAGYYAVDLLRYGIRAELTAAPHAGILRFTYPTAESARIQIDFSRRVGQVARFNTKSCQKIRVVDDDTLEGELTCDSADGGWMHGALSYRQYFVLRFSKPLVTFGFYEKDTPRGALRCYEGTNTLFVTEFATAAGERVSVKAGVSFTSLDGARANLEREIPGWDFDRVRADAAAAWRRALTENIRVEGGSDRERTIFATALYHAMIDPRAMSDVDGGHLGANGSVQRADGFVYRTVFSGWDVFRSEFPLLTLIRPDVVSDAIKSWIEMATLSGKRYFPRWELLNTYTGCMIGHPAVAVIADAYAKGIRDFDVPLATAYCRNTYARKNAGQLGFIPGELSWTLEAAYAAWALGTLLEATGEAADAARYFADARTWRNCWDPAVHWFRARLPDGPDGARRWVGKRFNKTEHGNGCVESNPYQQGWFVPHDIAGFKALAGESFLLGELETFFDKAPPNFRWNDYYNHPNEPCHHVAFLFNEFGRPDLTQKWTRRICEKAYGDDVYGLCGNEDVGQMSAWYVLAAIGLHPICPGDNKWQITSPVFPKTTIRLDPAYYDCSGGDYFVIETVNHSEKPIKDVRLDGQPLGRWWLNHREIKGGSRLTLVY